MTPLYCLYLILGITFLFNLSGLDKAVSVQNCVHPHLHRRKILPCLNAHLYMMGDFFQLTKCILVSQKDLISSLWALSAKTWRVVIRTGLRGQTLVRGQSPGGDSCGGDRAGNVSPEAKSPGGCSGGSPRAVPLSRDVELPRPPHPQCGRVGGKEQERFGGIWEGNNPGSSSRAGSWGRDTPFGG